MTDSTGNDVSSAPRFRRARGYYLYDSNGRRYLDLDLCGSRAVLGHKPAGLGRDLKAAVDLGLLDAQSDVEHERLFRQLELMFPAMRAVAYLDVQASHLHRVTLAGIEIALWRYGASAAGPPASAATAATAATAVSPVPPLQIVVLPVPDSSIALPLLVRRDQGVPNAALQTLAAAGLLHERVPGLAAVALGSVVHAIRRDVGTLAQGASPAPPGTGQSGGEAGPSLRPAPDPEVPDGMPAGLEELTRSHSGGALSCEVSGRYVQWMGNPEAIGTLQRNLADSGFYPPRSLRPDTGPALLFPVYLPRSITRKEYRRLGTCVTLN